MFNYISRPLRLKVVVTLSAFAAVLLLGPSAARAQNGDDDPITIDTSLVKLNIGVVDQKGHPITNLSRNDFKVYEDDKLQSIGPFELTDAPFSLVMLLDVSGSTAKYRQNLQLAALRFLDALVPDDRVCIIQFNEKADVMTKNFTSNRKDLVFQISRVSQGKGGTELYKALDVAMEKLRHEGKRRKAIVVLTDGGDTGMKDLDRMAVGTAATEADAISSIKPETSVPLRKVLNEADQQGVTIYPLALPTGDPKRLPDPNPLQIALYTAARQRLQIMADRTGGRLNAINALEDLGRLYAEVAADLRTLYTVTYQSSNTESKRPDHWRAIRIELVNRDLLARTRQGYFSK